jgi:hypothetical protein
VHQLLLLLAKLPLIKIETLVPMPIHTSTMRPMNRINSVTIIVSGSSIHRRIFIHAMLMDTYCTTPQPVSLVHFDQTLDSRELLRQC